MGRSTFWQKNGSCIFCVSGIAITQLYNTQKLSKIFPLLCFEWASVSWMVSGNVPAVDGDADGEILSTFNVICYVMS